MKLYVCDSCSKVFANPKTIKESRGEWFGFPSYEEFDACPYCNCSTISLEEFDEDPRTAEAKDYEYEEASYREMWEAYHPMDMGRRIL